MPFDAILVRLPTAILAAALRPTAVIVVAALSPAATLAVEPSAFDQYMLELINRARLDPDGEAARLGIDLNEGPPYQEISSEPKQPLCFHPLANDAALSNAEDLLTNFEQFPADHRGSDGSTPAQRVAAAGVDALAVTENTVWRSQLSLNLQAKYVDNLHGLLFRDFLHSPADGVPGRGHRVNLLFPSFNQIGLHVRSARYANRKVAMSVQNFVMSDARFLMGVAYWDSGPRDEFYSPGEGVGAVRITAELIAGDLRYEINTWSAGGYTLEVRPGVYRVTASGLTREPLVVSPVIVADENVKLDFVTSVAPPPPDPEPVFRIDRARARYRARTETWRLDLTRVEFSPGAWTFAGDLDEVYALVQGRSFFGPGERGGREPRVRRDRKTGEINRITIRGPDGERLKIDLRKRKLSLKIKQLDAFAIREGQDLDVEIRLGDVRATVTAPLTIDDGGRRTAAIEPAVGAVE